MFSKALFLLVCVKSGLCINSLPHAILTFKRPRKRSRLKTEGKEKMLVTNIFSFSHNFFYHITDKNHYFSNIKFVICECFQFERVQHFHNKIFDWSILKAFADDNLNVNQKFRFALGRVENIVGKGKNAGYQHFLLFLQCFQKATSLGSLKIGIVFKRVNPFPNKPWFLRVCNTSFLNTLWEKKKWLVMSNFSFSHNVFYPSAEISAIFITFEIVVCKPFQFGSV